ncbi:hypothetical protein ABPG72_008927 [Tetrahymena utriculariae]
MNQQRVIIKKCLNKRQNYHQNNNETGSSNNSVRRISLSSTMSSSHSRTQSRKNSRSQSSTRSSQKPLKKVHNRIKTPINNNQKQCNSKNEYINKQQRKNNNFQIIEKYIPLLIKDTKDENSQKIIQSKQKRLEIQKLQRMMKKKEETVQIVNEEEEEIEESKENTQQQLIKIKNKSQQQNNTNKNQKIQIILPTNYESISEESDNSINIASQLNIDQTNIINKIPHNTQVLTSSLITQAQSQSSSENIQTTQNNTKSSIQLGNPKSIPNFQIIQGWNNQSNIAPSSAGIETIANSTEFKQAIDQIQQNKLYDLNLIMKTKAYRNDNLQKIIPSQNPQLDSSERDKFIVGATAIPIFTEIKQEFIQNYQNVYNKHNKQLETMLQSINVIYNFQLWNKMIEGYKEEDLIIQTSKLYEEGNDPNSHFKKLAEIIHRYLRKICRKVTAELLKNQAYVLLETKEQYSINHRCYNQSNKKMGSSKQDDH